MAASGYDGMKNGIIYGNIMMEKPSVNDMVKYSAAYSTRAERFVNVPRGFALWRS